MPYADKVDLYKSQIMRWRRIKVKAIEYKGGACCFCGYKGHPAALQFHHEDPLQKDVAWNKLRLRSWDKITYELDKCVLLCANCHAVVHSVSKYDCSNPLS